MKQILLLIFTMAFSFSLSAQIWEDNFDDGDISDWTTYDVDGDGNNWRLENEGVGGSTCIISESFINYEGPATPNNYIVSPAIDLTNESGALALSWKAYAQLQDWPEEHYKVVISNEPLQASIDAGDNIFEETLFASGFQVWLERTADLTAYAGQVIYVSFVHYDCTDWFWLNIDDVAVIKPASDDAGITDAVAPSNGAGCSFTSEEYPSINLFNFGGNTLTGFEVSYAVNGGTPVVEVVSDMIAPSSELVYTFDTPVDLSALGDYRFEFTSSLDGDTDVTNNSFSTLVRHTDAVLTVHAMSDISNGHAWEVVDNATGEVFGSRGGYTWENEFFDDVCIYSDGCYTFNYVGQMLDGAFLEVLIDGTRVAGDTDGLGVPPTISIPSLGGGCAANEASLTSITTQRYHVQGDDATVQGVLTNFGTAGLGSVEMSYSVDGGAAVTELFTVTDAVLTGEDYAYSFSTPVNIADLTEYDLEVTVINVNGEADGNVSNNTVNSELVAVSFAPAKKVVAEEATGTWCPWCPRGAVFLDMMADQYEDFIGIAVHNQDPMVVSAYDDGLSALVPGYPSIVLDRTIIDADPGALALFGNLEADYESRLDVVAPLTIDMEVSYTGAGLMTIDVNSEFVAPVSGDIRFSVVVTQDGLRGSTATWAQANNYAGGTFGPMAGYENLPNPVPANIMVYDHVAIAAINGWDGAISSFPSNNTRGDVVEASYTWNITDIDNLDDMHVIAMVIDNATGNILNATETNLFITGVEETDFAASQIKVFPNPTSNFASIQLELTESTEVEMSITNMNGQVVAQRAYGKLNGNVILPFDGSSFATGMYSVKIKLGDSIVTKKLYLSK